MAAKKNGGQGSIECRKSTRLAAASMLALVLGVTVPQGRAETMKSEPTDDAGGPAYTVNTVASGLNHPWCLTFLPSGDMLVTERNGGIRIIRDGALDPTPISGAPEAYKEGQGGYFDIILHPEFETNRYVYLSYAHGQSGANATRIARAEFTGTSLDNVEVIFTVTPTKEAPVHYGGRMTFLPDGTLVMSTGDGFNYREETQKLDNLLGKIIRINDDGTIPEDNPFVGQDGAKPEIWSYGHRNPQGAIYDEETQRLYYHEHGPLGGDELNIIEKGKNYGWPVITYGKDYSGAKITPFTEMEGMEQPFFYWNPSIAPAGMTIYAGEKFPAWQGDIFVSALSFRLVERIDIEDGAIVGSENLFEELGERIRDVRTGPDGSLYLLTDNDDGSLLRIDPAP